MTQCLVPELYCTDLKASLDFYVSKLGFTISYERPEDHFAYLEYQGAELMLDQIGESRDWLTGEMEPPFGRGINLQIQAKDVKGLYQKVLDTGLKPFLELEEVSYRVGEEEQAVRQFLIQDPDGYLLRFQQDI